ncbi:MAG: hypothetical protein CVU63_22050 [Deltaproteobacteria bacterium HGW-Deltaproteobacteria-20]|nr:MAG: hypothetical protein CVU63_22050 [Deltaproteobacteria bacterium HGW-Deltaproteobacteria-20]
MRIMYETNPLSATCGRVCTHKCETVCALSHHGEAVAIRWLKRYALDHLSREDRIKAALDLKGTCDHPKKVAVIGSGPAGLSAAYYLAGLGHDVTIFERMQKAGGTMRYGIPAYRLPDDQLDAEIAAIEAIGVTIRYGVSIGRDISFDDLRAGPACRAGAEVLLSLWRDSRERHPYMFFMGTDFRKLKAPLVWYDLLHVLDVLSRFPWLRGDGRLASMADVLRAKADDGGRFTPESVWMPWRDWEFGQKREPSRWVTLLAWRIAVRTGLVPHPGEAPA